MRAEKRKRERAETASESHVTVRLPMNTIEEIDTLLEKRRQESISHARIPRHTWLLEAVYEKLQRERKRGNS